MCKFPGNLNNFSSVLEKDPVCPMCEASLPLSRLTLVPDPLSELRSLATVKEEETR